MSDVAGSGAPMTCYTVLFDLVAPKFSGWFLLVVFVVLGGDCSSVDVDGAREVVVVLVVVMIILDLICWW